MITERLPYWFSALRMLSAVLRWQIAGTIMRPDEHKQKHRAQYKKKHGISGKGDGTKKEEKSPKCPKSAEGSRNDELSDASEKFKVELRRHFHFVMRLNLTLGYTNQVDVGLFNNAQTLTDKL